MVGCRPSLIPYLPIRKTPVPLCGPVTCLKVALPDLGCRPNLDCALRDAGAGDFRADAGRALDFPRRVPVYRPDPSGAGTLAATCRLPPLP